MRDRLEELKHYEVLLVNVIEYLVALWEVNEKEELIDKFMRLGFTKTDIEEFGIGE